MSAGVAPTAEHQVERADVEWANVVFAMEDRHAEELERLVGGIPDDTALVVLGIPDRHPYIAPQLVEELERKLECYL